VILSEILALRKIVINLLYGDKADAEANPRKNSGLRCLWPEGARGWPQGAHTRITGTVADVYVTVADEVVGAGIGRFPTATKKIGTLLT